MPRDPKDLSLSAPEQVVRRLADSEDLARGGGRAFGSSNGAEGPEGPAGKNGATWYQGSSVPALALGVTGDFYYRTGTSDVYFKETESLWTIIANIKGEKGETGSTGASGKEGPAASLENTDWKNSVRCATTANIATATALNPLDVLDGVTLAENDRVLVKDQTTKSQNGIWIVKAVPERAADANAVAELSGGSTIYVEEGTKNKRRTFQIITPGNITPGTTAHEYQQLGFRDFGLVAALPTTEAVEGDKCVYKAKAGEMLWQFVYDGSGEFPWKFVGGGELYNAVDTDQVINSVTYANMATVGPNVTVPLKGVYTVRHSHRNWKPSGSYAFQSVGVSATGTAAGAQGATDARSSGPILGPGVAAATTIEITAAANDIFCCKYRVESEGANIAYRRLSVVPVRVG